VKRDLPLFIVTCALVVVLIPYPRLLPLSLVGLAVIWLATPVTSKPHRRAAKPSRSRGSYDSQ
jgi:hypothetical protein